MFLTKEQRLQYKNKEFMKNELLQEETIPTNVIHDENEHPFYFTIENENVNYKQSKNLDESCVKVNACTTCSGPHPPRLWTRFIPSCPVYQTPETKETNPNTYENLNERRKVQILQYPNNATTQTKKHLFSELAQGKRFYRKTFAVQGYNYSNPNTQNLELVNNTLICRRINKKCSWTYECDVPGPARQLCYNPDVTLYMYKKTYTYPNGGKWPQTSGNSVI